MTHNLTLTNAIVHKLLIKIKYSTTINKFSKCIRYDEFNRKFDHIHNHFRELLRL